MCGFGFRRVWGLGFGVWGLGFGVWVFGLGFRVDEPEKGSRVSSSRVSGL